MDEMGKACMCSVGEVNFVFCFVSSLTSLFYACVQWLAVWMCFHCSSSMIG